MCEVFILAPTDLVDDQVDRTAGLTLHASCGRVPRRLVRRLAGAGR
jgi:hypothetical protein